MDLAIIGLEQSGKTTVFNALCGGHAQTGHYGEAVAHLGVARVLDRRLECLAAQFHPHQTTPAEVHYRDFPGLGFTRAGVPPQFVATLAQADALLMVVRAFARPDVPHAAATIDPHRDIAAMDAELIFTDLAFVERRLDRLATEIRTARPSEREAGQREMALLKRVGDGLEGGAPLRRQELTPPDRHVLAQYPLLTGKPLLIIVNAGEEDAGRLGPLEEEYRRCYDGGGAAVALFCGELEMELAQLSPAEVREFRPQIGLEGWGPERVVEIARRLLGLIGFYTINDAEGRAWMVPQGTTAHQAAGKIHSDMERGFIRAEVINWQVLLEARSMAEARKRGLVSSQGKGYIVQEGDVLHILFNV